jgi:hypothetical protein
MAFDCDLLTDGFDMPCATQGGLTEIYIASYSDAAVWDISSPGVTGSVISGATMTNTFFTFEHDVQQAFFEAPSNSNRANGTVVYEANITIKMNILDNVTRNLFYALTRSFVTIIAKTTAGEYVVLGALTPGKSTDASIMSGTLLDDMSGGTITFNFLGAEPLHFADWDLLEPDLTIA